jgi:hypothetical protein
MHPYLDQMENPEASNECSADIVIIWGILSTQRELPFSPEDHNDWHGHL